MIEIFLALVALSEQKHTKNRGKLQNIKSSVPKGGGYTKFYPKEGVCLLFSIFEAKK